MIATSTGGLWILLAVVCVTLYLFWVVLSWTFNLIDRAHERMRHEDALSDRERGY